MAKKKSIFFKGHYGFENLGDDIFTVSADWICNNLWKNTKPIFIGSKLPRLSNNAKTFNSNNRLLRKLYEFYTCLKVSNIIHFGGSVRIKLDGSYRDFRHYLYKMKIFHSKLSTIGTGLGPYNDLEVKKVMQDYLSYFKFIAVRGYSSLSYLEEMGLKNKSSFCFDLAILINDIYPQLKVKDKSTDGSVIGISLCHYERYTNGNLLEEQLREEAVFKFVDKVVQTNKNIKEIVFFEFNGNKIYGDTQITHEFYNTLKEKIKCRIVNYSTDTEAFCKEINNCDLMIGMRLHSAILAYSLDVPFMLVEYHPKCTEFLNTINHNFRFNVSDLNTNLQNFSSLLEEKRVPNIIESSYFKKIMFDELDRIYKLL